MAKQKKRENGYYQKTIVLGRKPDGKYLKKTVYGKTLKELDAKVIELTQQLNSGIRVWESNMKFSELAQLWLDQYHPTETEKWKYRQRTLIAHHLLPTLGDMKVCDLRQLHLQCIISDLARKQYSTSTMKKIKQTAVRIMKVAIESDLIIKNPFENVIVPTIEAPEKRALTEEEITLITEHWMGHRFGHGAMIMLYAGLRRGELLALEWKDIDFEARVIHVYKAWEVITNVPHIKKPKTRAGTRDVPIPSLLYDALISVRKKTGFVCPDATGKIMTETGYSRAWESFMNYLNECAGGKSGSGDRHKIQVIDHFTAHMLRHTYATMLFDAGVDVKSAQRFLGHADVEVTLNIYTHLTKYKEDKAIEALNEHIQSRCMNRPALKVVKGGINS